MRFEWDNEKASRNIKKHGVSFGEATDLFFDDGPIIFDDPDHSIKEDRYLMVGLSREGRLLIVSFCERDSGEVIRIISSRKLTRSEERSFMKRWRR